MKQKAWHCTTKAAPEFSRGKASKHVLFLALLFGCQLLADCNPRSMVKVTQRPGYVSRHEVSYDGPDADSVFRGLESAGFSRMAPGQQPCGFEGLFSMITGRGFDNPMFPTGQTSIFEAPWEQGRRGSTVSPPFETDNWRQQARRRLDNMRNSMFNGMNIWGQGVGGRRPTRITPSNNDDNDEVPAAWTRLGGDNANTRGRNGGQIGGGGEERNRRGSSGWRGGRTGGGGGSNRSGSGNFHKENLDAHNEYRAKHGVPPLKLNDRMSAISQSWAQHLASRGSVYGIHHSDKEFNKGYGENIHASAGYSETGRTAVDNWYEEIHDYDFTTGMSPTNRKIGHLTQLLWDDSKELGVGFAYSSSGAIFVVCHYNPPGNYIGQNTRHVPPIGGFTAADRQRQAEEDERQRQRMFGSMRFGQMPSFFGNSNF